MGKTKTPPKDQRVIAKYRQYYASDKKAEQEKKFSYCLVLTDKETKRALLAGDEDAEFKVLQPLFQQEHLLVGNGLCHEMSFLEEHQLAGRHEAIMLII